MTRLLSFTIACCWLCIFWTSHAVAAHKSSNQETAEAIADALRDADLNGFNIAVQFQAGVATLEGTVSDASQKLLASQITSGIEGVEKVVNLMKVQAAGTEHEAGDVRAVLPSSKEVLLPILISRSAVITRQPEVMRMSLDVVTGGMKVEEALEQHSALKQYLRAKMLKLGAVATSMEFSDIKTFKMSQEEWWTYNKNRIRWMSSSARKDITEKKPAAIPVIVASVLTVEWKLEPLEDSEHFRNVVSLQKNIHEALSAVKSKGLLLEESELEIAEAFNIPFPYLEAPLFTFTAPISQEEKRLAMEKAIEEARSEAGLMASAAKVKLGKLLSIRKKEASVITYSDTMASGESLFSPAGYALFSQLENEENLSLSEVVGVNAQKAQLKITVTLGFDLESPNSGSEEH